MSLAERARKDHVLAGDLIAAVFLSAERMGDDKARAGCILIGSALARYVSEPK